MYLYITEIGPFYITLHEISDPAMYLYITEIGPFYITLHEISDHVMNYYITDISFCYVTLHWRYQTLLCNITLQILYLANT